MAFRLTARLSLPSTSLARAAARTKLILSESSKGGFGRPSFIGQQPLAATSLLAFSLAWLIPNHYPPWTSFYNEGAMVVALIILTCAANVHQSKVALSTWFVAAIATLPWLQWIAGTLHFSGDAFVASAYLAALAISIQVGRASGDQLKPALPELLSGAALFSGVVSALIAISQSLNLLSWGMWAEYATTNMRAVGNLGQPNNLATLFGIGAVGAMYLFERGRLSAGWTLSAACLLVVAGALTQSRISLLFGVLAVIALLILRARGVAARTQLTVVVSLTVAHWLLMWAAPAMLSALFGDAPATLASRGLETPRYQMWRMLLDAVNRVPWTGYGWLQVGAAELAVAEQYPPIKELWLHGHNVFIELVVWCGWPVGVLIGVALLFWFVSRARRIQSVESAAGMLVIGFVGAHALVELPHHYLYFLIPAGLWAGIVERDEASAAWGRGWLAFIPAVAAFAIFGKMALEYPAVEEDFRLVRFEAARIGNVRATRPSPAAPTLSSLTTFLKFARTEPAPGMSEVDLLSMGQVTQRYPYAPSLARYASALALNGRLQEARDVFVKMRYIHGDRTYVRFRNDLQEKVAGGQSGFAELLAQLPPTEAFNP